MIGLPDVKLHQSVLSADIISSISEDMIAPPTSNNTTSTASHNLQKPATDDVDNASFDEEDDASWNEDEEVNVEDQPTPQQEESERIHISVLKCNDDSWPFPIFGPKLHKGIKEGCYKVGHDTDEKDNPGIIRWLRQHEGPFDQLCKSVEPQLLASINNGPLSAHLLHARPGRKTRNNRK